MLGRDKEAEVTRKLSFAACREVSWASPVQRERMGRIPACGDRCCFFKVLVGGVLSPCVVGSWFPTHSDLDRWQDLGAIVFPQVSHWKCWGWRHHSYPPCATCSCFWEAMEAASSVSKAKGASLEKYFPKRSLLVPSPVPQIPAEGLRSWHLKAWLASQPYMSLHFLHWIQNLVWWNVSAFGSSPVLAVITVIQGHLCEKVREMSRLHCT